MEAKCEVWLYVGRNSELVNVVDGRELTIPTGGQSRVHT